MRIKSKSKKNKLQSFLFRSAYAENLSEKDKLIFNPYNLSDQEISKLNQTKPIIFSVIHYVLFN